MHPQVDIDQLRLTLKLRGERERLEPVARRLRDLSGQRLASALARVELGPGDDEDAYIFIERLSVECGADTAWDDHLIAEHIAKRVAMALHARLEQEPVLRFRDRAEFLAAYLTARASGHADECWWFDEFEGLGFLSVSAALRTVIINEGNVGVSAASRLNAAALNEVLAALAQGDTSRLLAAWGARRSSAKPPLPLVRQAATALERSDSEAAWLQALLTMERQAPGSLGSLAVTRIKALRRIGQWLQDGKLALPEHRHTWLQELEAQGDGLDLSWLREAGEAELGDLFQELSNRAAQSPARSGNQRWLATPHGGFFLLLARLERRGCLAAWERCAVRLLQARHVREPQDQWAAEAQRLARQLAVCVCAAALAEDDPASVLNDSAVALACETQGSLEALCGHARLMRRMLRATPPMFRRESGPTVSPEMPLPPRLRRLIGQAAGALLADFAYVVPGLAQASAGYLRRNALALSGVFEEAAHTVHLGHAPLDVLLVLCGAKRGRLVLPGQPTLLLREDVG